MFYNIDINKSESVEIKINKDLDRHIELSELLNKEKINLKKILFEKKSKIISLEKNSL